MMVRLLQCTLQDSQTELIQIKVMEIAVVRVGLVCSNITMENGKAYEEKRGRKEKITGTNY